MIKNFITYLKSTKNLSGSTLRAYSYDLSSFCEFEKNLLYPDICAYISHLQSLHIKDTSIKRKIVSLRIFYDYLAEKKLIDRSPFNGLKFRFRQEHKLPKTLSIAEVKRLLECFEESDSNKTMFASKQFTRDAALIDLLISTGIRVGEAAAIKFEDIIMYERSILIHGKGRKQRIIFISSPVTWNASFASCACRKNIRPRNFYLQTGTICR